MSLAHHGSLFHGPQCLIQIGPQRTLIRPLDLCSKIKSETKKVTWKRREIFVICLPSLNRPLNSIIDLNLINIQYMYILWGSVEKLWLATRLLDLC